MLAAQVHWIEATLGSSSLGGCPASCPDTYRLTHDHRHVRNWARVEIRLLTLVRKIFFELGTHLRKPVRGALALSARKRGQSEQALSLVKDGKSRSCAESP